MTFSLVFDDASLLLTLTIILLLSLTIYIGKGYQPLVHPLILSRQSDISPIRHRGQSAIYRNASSPSGLELASKPRRKINGVLDMLQSGSDTPDWSFKAKRNLYGQQKSNEDVINAARGFAKGLAEITGATSTSDLRVAVCSEVDSIESLEVIISGNVQEKSGESFTPLVIHPSLTDQSVVLEGLPSSSSLKQTHAVFTTAASLSAALRLPTVNKDTIVIVASEQEAQSIKSLAPNKVMLFEEVLARSSSAISIAEKSEVSESTSSPSKVHSYYYSEKARWVEVTNASLIAALTAHLAFYPAQSQPSKQDHILVATSQATSENKGASSPHLSAAYHPAGLVLPLLALYTGAAFSTSTMSSSPDVSDATLLFTSPSGASTLATALCKLSRRNPFVRPASNSKLAFLRHGTFSSSTIWDKIVFNSVRRSIHGDKLRSVLLITESNSVSQELLDVLRIQLSCTVRQAYLPISPLTAVGIQLTAGIGQELANNSTSALATAPLNAVHSLDLQAFAEEDDFNSTHVGPPNVAVEMKLVETALFKSMNYKDARIGQDSVGEVRLTLRVSDKLLLI